MTDLEIYTSTDLERFVSENRRTDTRRSEFARDRARVLHSSALRRLGAKTQVLEPTSGDFARTRLTHSLEVAQVGREMAVELGLDADLVDMACLSHDLGHPPFGHNGETALNEWAASIGGFEGNAQTLRLLTRLEPKFFTQAGEPIGLNLTRASIDATCKYPWTVDEATTTKFGVYADDIEIFNWVRLGAPVGVKSIEAQVMDFADDVAYSVHDFEDAVVAGFIRLAEVEDRAHRADLIKEVQRWSSAGLSVEDIDAAFERLQASKNWAHEFTDSELHRAKLKNLTSDLIGSFVRRATVATQNEQSGALTRFESTLVVPSEVRAEIEVLKGLVSAFLMSHESRRPFYEAQRELLIELADALFAAGDQYLDAQCSALWRGASDEAAQRRVVVDQIALLTDQGARLWHDRLVGSDL